MNMFVGLCLCVSVYDQYHVFMGLRNRYPCVFFFIKLPMCFCEEEKKEKEWSRRSKKNGRWSEFVKKKWEKKIKK